MTEIDIDMTLNAESLRQQALQQWRDELDSKPLALPRRSDFLFPYYYHWRLGLHLLLISMEERYDPSQKIDGSWLINRIIWEDTKKVNYPLALAAWLTIDNWRAHETENPNVPEDLSYELVNSCPIPILRLANQFLNPQSPQAYDLSRELVEESRDYATRIVKEEVPEVTDEKLNRIIPPNLEAID